MTGSEADDIVARAGTGDPSAWRELYEANAGRLLLWLRTTPGSADADDIAAEAWLVAARKVSSFSGGRHEFTGWLFGIARNLSRNSARRASRRGTSPYPLEDDTIALWGVAEDPFGEVDARDLAVRLLATLPQREAETIACVDVVGLDITTTARALGISAPAVRVARHRGLRRLRGLLAAAESGTQPNVAEEVNKPGRV
jgi:RNA polymerase sigma-70 factor (ECF subfamily)